MNRRALLAAAGTTAAAGCLGDGTFDDVETAGGGRFGPDANESCEVEAAYEECQRLLVAYDSLPAPVQCEIDAALEGGYSTTGRILLEDALDVDHAYVRTDDATYEPTVTDSGDERRLELVEADRLTRRRVHEMWVENATDDRRTVAVAVERVADGELVVDETVELAAGDRAELEVSDVLGRYAIAVSDDRGHEERVESRLGEYFQFDALIVGEELALFESTADVAPCPWER